MTAQDRSIRSAARRARNRRLATPNADGSRLEGYVEHPLDGSAVERRTVVSGWHAWDRHAVAAVVVEMDGRIIGRAVVGDPARDDVADARDDARYAATGWVAAIDLGGVHTPTATVVAMVYPSEEHAPVRLEPITVTVLGDPTIDLAGTPIPPPPVVTACIDVPAPGAQVELAPLRVRGWARSTYAPIAQVELSANGVALGRARIGIDRFDVAATDDAPDAAVCGFEQVVDLGALDATTTSVAVTASITALDGTTGTVEVAGLVARLVAPAVPPLGATLPDARATDGPLGLLVVTHDLGYGGAQLWLHEVLRAAQAGTSFGCTVVAFGDGALRRELEAMGVEVHVTSPFPVDDAAKYEGRAAELAAWCEGRALTAALVNTFRAFAGADVAERLGLPTVWAVHESWPERLIWTFDHPSHPVDPAVRATARRALGSARAVVFESASTEALYAPFAPGRTVVVPYGVDTAALDRIASTMSRADARAALDLDPDGRILLVMGTIEPRKAQSTIVQAFCEVADAHRDTRLVLVGDLRTDYSAGIAEFVARAGLADRVMIVPVTHDAPTWYRASNALVCASDIESLPRSVLDAMCLGLPVVATRVFGLAELLVDDETAVLYDPLDLAQLVSALERTLSMPPSTLARIAAAGSSLIHAHHDASLYAMDVLALVRGLTADPTSSPEAVLRAAGRELRYSSRR